MLFIKQLKDHPRFQYGVHWNEANFEKVFITELDNARVPQRGGGSAQSSGGIPGRSVDAAAAYGQAWDTAVFFRLDVQFGPSAEAPAGGIGPARRESGLPGGQSGFRGRDRRRRD
jgi:hypothetical protein